jgi:hypothetical protein
VAEWIYPPSSKSPLFTELSFSRSPQISLGGVAKGFGEVVPARFLEGVSSIKRCLETFIGRPIGWMKKSSGMQLAVFIPRLGDSLNHT